MVLQRTLDEVADSALMVAQTGVGIWKGGLQKADDQVGIGDFHAIDRDERRLSTRRIANALLGDGFEGDSLETKMCCQLRRKRQQRRDPARDVGIENCYSACNIDPSNCIKSESEPKIDPLSRGIGVQNLNAD